MSLAPSEPAMTYRDRFFAVMDYRSFDKVPNHELGIWPQCIERWNSEGADLDGYTWNWFWNEPKLGFDERIYLPLNYGMIPPFDYEVLERTDRYEVFRDGIGIVHKALIEGTVGGGRMCMDQYLSFPVETREDFAKLRKRYEAVLDKRYPADYESWKKRFSETDAVRVLGTNCAACGFYWRAREWMGTENLSYAWYDDPALCHEMMEFFADFTIEVSKPAVESMEIDYFCLNEDMSMKNGPLLSPDTYRTFILPHLMRLVRFMKSNGVKYFVLDTDGNCEALIPSLMEAGVDVIWPLERASDMDPVRIRAKYGRDLRLWGGVDKRVLAENPRAIDAHLSHLAPLVEEGGYIPTVDHTVPPDVSWRNLMHYMEAKQRLLAGQPL